MLFLTYRLYNKVRSVPLPIGHVSFRVPRQALVRIEEVGIAQRNGKPVVAVGDVYQSRWQAFSFPAIAGVVLVILPVVQRVFLEVVDVAV